jgi:hypothetical protein
MIFTGKAILVVKSRKVEPEPEIGSAVSRNNYPSYWTKDVTLFTVKEYTHEEARESLRKWYNSNDEMFTLTGRNAMRFEITSKVTIYPSDINDPNVERI